MLEKIRKFKYQMGFLFLLGLLMSASVSANNEVLGAIRFRADNNPAKSAGVWVDGKYVGYLSELKGSKKLLLLPGEHEISVRQAGYRSVEQKINVQPNQVQTLRVLLAKDPEARFP